MLVNNMEFNFKKNLGTTDRVIRTLLGIILIALVIGKVLTGWLGTLLIVFAIFLFVDAFFSYWIGYDLMGWSTR